MNFQKIRTLTLVFLFASTALFAQQGAEHKKSATAPEAAPAKRGEQPKPATNSKPNRADAYYHFSLGHMYEEMMAMYGRSDYASKAIEEYRLAIQADPSSDFLNAQRRTFLNVIPTTFWPTSSSARFISDHSEIHRRERSRAKC
jgi:hypothetical protein